MRQTLAPFLQHLFSRACIYRYIGTGKFHCSRRTPKNWQGKEEQSHLEKQIANTTLALLISYVGSLWKDEKEVTMMEVTGGMFSGYSGAAWFWRWCCRVEMLWWALTGKQCRWSYCSNLRIQPTDSYWVGLLPLFPGSILKMSAFYLSLVIFCQAIIFLTDQGSLNDSSWYRAISHIHLIFFYSYFNLFFHNFFAYLLIQNISLFLLRLKLVFILSPSCVKQAPTDLTGTKHMAFSMQSALEISGVGLYRCVQS